VKLVSCLFIGAELVHEITARRYVCATQDEPFVDIVNGRVILAYPCEPNYWTYFRPEDEGIAGDPRVPTLNLVGCDDQYFGRRNSVAARVAEVSDLPAVRGHAFETMVERGLSHGLVCHFEGAVHTLLRTHDSVVREVLTDFLQRPQVRTTAATARSVMPPVTHPLTAEIIKRSV
jgi:hypothetical protein